MRKQKHDGVEEGFLSSTMYKDSMEEAHKVIEKNRLRIKKGMDEARKKGPKFAIQKSVEWGFIGLTGATGSSVISQRYDLNHIAAVFAICIMALILINFKMQHNTRRKTRRRMLLTIENLFHEFRADIVILMLTLNKKFNNHNTKQHDHYMDLIRDGEDRARIACLEMCNGHFEKQKDMIEKDYKDREEILVSDLNRMAQEYARMKGRLTGKLGNICKECPNRHQFDTLIDEVDKTEFETVNKHKRKHVRLKL